MAIERSVFFSRAAARLLFAAGAAGLLAGCSDASRLADPFSDPFQGFPSSRGVDRAPTATIARPRPDLRRNDVEQRPLPPADRDAPAPRAAAPAPTPALAARMAGGYNHWSAEGGTPIVIADGETAAIVATRYGVPVDALVRVNGFARASDVHPGSRVIVPVYRASAAAPEAQAAPRPVDPRAKGDKRAKVAESKPRHEPERRAEAKPERAQKGEQRHAKLETRSAPIAKKKPADAPPKTLAQAAPAPQKREKIAQAPLAVLPAPRVDKTPTASIPAPPVEKQPAVTTVPATPTADARPEFRWPARGRIIQGFASGGNDGINISVPEGTPVKAAEGGVVKYAGSELKGYGNLVLISHPNGFVTAYAHNGELSVQRGEVVKRGQVIAKSGQSGNVGSPQLHFELRKGSTPVDPTNYLAGL